MSRTLTAGFALAALLALTQASFADEKDAKGAVEQLGGVIKAIDAKVGSLQLVQTGEARAELKLNLARSVKVIIDGKDGKLADLKEGLRVQVQVSRAADEVVVIRVGGERADGEKGPGDREGGVRGVLKELDAAKNKLVLTIRRDGQEPTDQTFTLTKETKVQPGKQALQLGDLKPGRTLSLQLAEDRKTVVVIVPGEQGGKGRGFEIIGTLNAIDKDKGTVTVTYLGEGRDVERTFPLDKESKVAEGIKPGQRVRVQVGPDRKSVVGITPGDK